MRKCACLCLGGFRRFPVCAGGCGGDEMSGGVPWLVDWLVLGFVVRCFVVRDQVA